MKPSSQSVEQTRKDLLEQLAAISTMQPGTIAEEWRQRPGAPGKGSVRRGPYFKHQAWLNGRNVSRRVPPAQVGQLREDIANHHRFEELCRQLEQLNIEHTQALRAAEAAGASRGESADAKKNSARNASPKGTARPKRSSARRGRGSRGKG